MGQKPDTHQHIVDQAKLAVEEPSPGKADGKAAERPAVEDKSRIEASSSKRFLQQKSKTEPKHKLKEERTEEPHCRVEQNLGKSDMRITHDRLEVVEAVELQLVQVKEIVVLEGHDGPPKYGIVDKRRKEEQRWNQHPTIKFPFHHHHLSRDASGVHAPRKQYTPNTYFQ
ncbi:hypothetical protein SDC9_94431 [bioreactor metagenome]|uniref:Uncharacterized protein n=1 Tax=bioreactor metagenome TaxID=1076179 RepID=A0A645A3S0_9ZZZZ